MKQRFQSQAEQHWLFFRQWVRAPLSTASVVPSSRFLAEKMVAEVPRNARKVIELGAGTGVFTERMLARGAPFEKLMVVELNPELAGRLVHQFPQVTVVNGDASHLVQLLQDSPDFHTGQVDAILSGLGLLNIPNPVVTEIIRAAFDVLAPGAPFIQFTYGPKSPIARSIVGQLGLSVHRASFTLRNFPPASVYVYRRAKV